MIHKLKPYPAYKDSGVPWLGEVPEHWEVVPLKTISKRIQNGSTPSTEIPEYYTDNGLPWFGPSSLGQEIRIKSPMKHVSNLAINDGKVRVISPPALVVSVIGNIGQSALLFEKGATNQQITCFELDDTEIFPEFIGYEFQLAKNALSSFASSSTIPILDTILLKNTPITLPSSISEQSAIVHYLDYMDRRIRRYINTKQKLIKLLEEQKQAIIHRAVTRGLDPDVKLKDSGVEWLREVPEHWEMRRNGRLFSQRNQTGYPDLPILEVSLKTGINIRDFDNGTRKQVMSDKEKYKRTVKGDIAYNMMRMWQGAVGVAPVSGLVSPAYVVARPLDGVNPEYYNYLFRTAAYMREVDSCSRGIVKDRNRLYWEDFKQIQSPHPPIEEQNLIVADIKKDISIVGRIIDSTNKEIDLLAEYRTSLISDVVTGKVDVREEAANLPVEIVEKD